MNLTPKQIDSAVLIRDYADEQVGHYSRHRSHTVAFTRTNCDPYRRQNAAALVLHDAQNYAWTDRVI